MKMKKNIEIHVRISQQEKALLSNLGIPISAVFRAGLNTLSMWIQSPPSYPCIYIHKIGNHTLPPAVGPLPPSEPPAQVCPCLACPVRAAFEQVPHLKSIDKKE